MKKYVLGAFWGAAIGDALGGPLEGMTRKQIKEQHGQVRDMLGGGRKKLQPGQYTDDTEMALMVAEGILTNAFYPVEEIGVRFLRWYYANPDRIGLTTIKSFENYLDCGNWREAAVMTSRTISKMDSNGALMRTLPVTFAYWSSPRDMAFWSKEIASMTHYGDESTACCIFYNYLIGAAAFLKGDKRDLFTKTLIFADQQCGRLGVNPSNFFWYIVRAVQSGAEEIVPQNKALDTLAASLQCFLNTDSLEEAIVKVVNLGGDADTAGSVIGGLAGAYYGIDAIPKRWIRDLHARERLVRVADEFANFENALARQLGSVQ